MGRLSIGVKLWIAFSALIAVATIPLGMGLGKLLTTFYHSQVTEPLLYHSRQLAQLVAESPEAVRIAPMMGQMVGGEVLIVDRTGTPVPFPGAATIHLPGGMVHEMLRQESYTGQVELGVDNPANVTAVRIPQVGGAVALIAPARPVQQSLTMARRYLLLAGAGSLLLGAGLAFMLARSLVRPVLAIEQATIQIARGDFSTRVASNSSDEIGQLAGAVNQMTAQLEGFENRRREFLANVAHELRTPLSYIRGYAQAVAEGFVPESDRNQYLRIVQEEAVRLGRLVDDLMDMAQMDEGQLAFDLQPLDIRLPIAQAVATLEPLAREKGVAVEADLPGHVAPVLADGGRIQQVVVNLLDNGLRYTPEQGRLSVSVRQEETAVVVRVTDTGQGIEASDLPVIFERFHKRDSQGRGLGLAIVRSIVKAHGGQVGVQSRAGQGSTFWFRLPVP